MKLSFDACKFGPEMSHTMPRKVFFSHLMPLPARILWGVHELLALQRSRPQPRSHSHMPRFHSR